MLNRKHLFIGVLCFMSTHAMANCGEDWSACTIFHNGKLTNKTICHVLESADPEGGFSSVRFPDGSDTQDTYNSNGKRTVKINDVKGFVVKKNKYVCYGENTYQKGKLFCVIP